MRFRLNSNTYVTVMSFFVLGGLAGAAPAQEIATPFVASDPAVVARMVKLAALSDGETAVDLGSGDGRIVLEAVRSNPKVTGWGVDIDAKLVERANAAAREQGLSDRARFFHRNAFDADLRKVDVIFLWLLPELQQLLRTKILAEARPGTRVIAHYTNMGSWPPDQVDDQNSRPVYAWVVPAKVAGNWSWTLPIAGGKRSYAVVLEQHFQNLEGVLRVGAQRTLLRDMKLRGTEISFKLTLTQPGIGYTGHDFAGKVVGARGDRIEGKVKVLMAAKNKEGNFDTRELPWRAVRVARSAYFVPTGLPELVPMPE